MCFEDILFLPGLQCTVDARLVWPQDLSIMKSSGEGSQLGLLLFPTGI